MIRMVNLTCLKCGMSLDVNVETIECYCPNCGGKLYMSAPQVIDVLEQKREIKRKDVKYATALSDVQIVRRTGVHNKKNIDIWICRFIYLLLLVGLNVLINMKSVF